MASPRSRLPPLHTRNISTVTVESDSSDTSANPCDDDDTDYFMAHANDSQSSLGAVTVVRDCDQQVDLEQKHRMTPIAKLPPEILMAIFARLTTTSDLRNCMLVSYHWALYAVGILWHRPLCNKWSNLQTVTRSLQAGERSYFPYHEMVKRLNLSAIFDKLSDGSVTSFMTCKGIERLTLTNCSKLTDFGVSGLVDGCRKLQALDVTDLEALTDATLSVVADNCTKLQGLNVTNCSNITDESLAQIADRCRHLKRLKLNGVNKITDASVVQVAKNCRSILEIDLAQCTSISSASVTALLSNLAQLRELRLAHCSEITDSAFVNLNPALSFDALRILDLTACEQVRDDAIARIIPAAPRLRNLVLAKCRHITDRAVASICKLTKNLHYIHLGHCINLTDAAVIQLVKACNRIRYIDLACCSRLTDASVRHLAQLPKLRRIGLVKCQNLTDTSIIALANGPYMYGPATRKNDIPSQFVSLERVHLSYCVNLTLKGITALLHNCPRLTHLSLTGVQAFLREDLTRFCRDAPAEFTHPQRDVFCVFSGDGVQRLRDYLMRMAMEQADREGRDPIDDSLLDGVESPGVDTMSDDGTIDGNDQGMDLSLPPRRISPFINNPRLRVRPRSLHELPSYHVEMPLFSNDQIQRYGQWTPNEGPSILGPASQPVLGTQPIDVPPYSRRSRSPAVPGLTEMPPGPDQDILDSARTPSRRHTLVESSHGYFGHQPPAPTMFPPQTAFERFADVVRPQRRQQPQFVVDGPGPVPPHHGAHLYDLGMRSAQDIRQTYLRPDHDFSAFDANHEAIMSTIPASRSASRHPSRSNSPHLSNPSRVSSRSRLSNILSSIRTNPFSGAEGRGPFGSRSLSRSRREEEEHRQRMLHALAEADAAQQLRPDVRRAESSRTVELPYLVGEQIERVASAPAPPPRMQAPGPGSGNRTSPPPQASSEASEPNEPNDVTMTQ
ncbi:SCF E3 ubiquitin ligase complex F-box protein grrA [Cyphellophora attinorum]|uniref:SCF E3 ubiquitin ligase complex F-box protein grrA n=1 Tax=Cyphellophora attinorum TaxID=1664694 RepID=A0A0N0NHJ8_9EURO|nr:SCF E3 ubiquitin ligase complex F-box protein grrA [Phialophora attinorum]KPI34648.1 SCF E3 ubiquitin ligase complex F-box protein grrA [Phialophora attinorum]